MDTYRLFLKKSWKRIKKFLLKTYFNVAIDTLVKVELTELSEYQLSQIERGFDVFIKGSNLRVLAATVDQENEENTSAGKAEEDKEMDTSWLNDFVTWIRGCVWYDTLINWVIDVFLNLLSI